jgi:hypothetical protein
LTTARMTAFSPAQSPPLVNKPRRIPLSSRPEPLSGAIVFGQRPHCQYNSLMLRAIAAAVIEVRMITHDRIR